MGIACLDRLGEQAAGLGQVADQHGAIAAVVETGCPLHIAFARGALSGIETGHSIRDLAVDGDARIVRRDRARLGQHIPGLGRMVLEDQRISGVVEHGRLVRGERQRIAIGLPALDPGLAAIEQYAERIPRLPIRTGQLRGLAQPRLGVVDSAKVQQGDAEPALHVRISGLHLLELQKQLRRFDKALLGQA